MGVRHCTTCKEPLSAIRLAAQPNAVQCVGCLATSGDVRISQGHMVWDHKTAPYIEINTELARTQPNAHPRQGRSGKTLSGSGLGDTTITDGVVVNVQGSRCHPTRPSVGPSQLCVECAVEWYRRRSG